MSVDHVQSMPSVVIVTRSCDEGHDRAYVTFGRRDLGHRDLLTGSVRCRHVADSEVVERATAALFTQLAEARLATAAEHRFARS